MDLFAKTGEMQTHQGVSWRSRAVSSVLVLAPLVPVLVASHPVAAATVLAEGRGRPWINLSDGQDLPHGYRGAAGSEPMLEDGEARPLALAGDDFDGDGVADLVTAYGVPGGGVLTLHLGNVDSIYPSSPAAVQRRARGAFTGAPFLSPARVVAVPGSPDFLGTGDFDRDGHRDVVAAARGGSSVYLLRGQGNGQLGPAREIALPGRLTAFATGPFNRANGVANVVVALLGEEGPTLLVLESGAGGLLRQPGSIALPGEATALAVAHLDDDAVMDLAAAIGHELLIAYGRHHPSTPRSGTHRNAPPPPPVPPGAVDRLSFPFALAAVTAHDLEGDGRHRATLALLAEDGTVHRLEPGAERSWTRLPAVEEGTRGPVRRADGSGPLLVAARVSTRPGMDLVVIDSANHQLNILAGGPGRGRQREEDAHGRGEPVPPVSLDVEGEPVAVLPLRLNGDALSDLVVLRRGRTVPTVLLTKAKQVFTVNSTADVPDGVLGNGVCDTGTPSSGPTGICTLRAALEEADQTADHDEIRFNIVSPDVKIVVNGNFGTLGALRPVTVDGTTQPGTRRVLIDGSQAGPSDPGGGPIVGFELVGQGSTVRGLEIANFDLDGFRIRPSGGPVGNNVVEGNIIAFNGRHGVHVVSSPSNRIGGTTAAAGNQILRNRGNGVRISGQDARTNLVQGNRIGTSVDMASDGSNEDDAIVIDDAPETTIGEPEPIPPRPSPTGASNVIVGKKLGVDIEGLLTTSTKTQLNGNFLGLPTIDATLAGGFFSEGSLFTAGGNLFTKVSGAEIEAFFKVSGSVDIVNNKFMATAVTGARLTFAEDRDITFEFQNNEVKSAGTGLVGEEILRSKVRWDVFGNQVEATNTAYSLMLRNEIQKRFGPNEELSAQLGGTFLVTTELPEDLALTLLLQGVVSTKSGQDGFGFNFGGRGIIGVPILGGGSANSVRNGYRFDVGVAFGGQVTGTLEDMQATLNLEAGLFAVNRTSVLSVLTLFVERDLFDDNTLFGVNIFNTRARIRSIDDNVITNNGVGLRLAGGSEADVARNVLTGNGVAVQIEDTSQADIVGNTMSGNGSALLLAGSGAGANIRANSIFANGGLGIDLGNNGVTPNDPGDGDTGPNGLQNFPVLTSASSNGGVTTVLGSLDSTPNSVFSLEFFASQECDASGFGEGETFLGSIPMAAGGSGTVAFTVNLPATVPQGQLVTATARGPSGGTSEFSRCVPVGAGGGTPADAIRSLIAQVQSLGLPQALEDSLVAKLQAALVALAQGDVRGAANQVALFKHQVWEERGRQIPVAEANELLAAAQSILNSLGIPDVNV